MRIAAAILAGGKASRLGGIAKGLMPAAGGISIVGRLLAELAEAGIADVVISTNNPLPYAIFARPLIVDVHREIGPLGGIEAILQQLAPRFSSVVLLPCDLPNLTVQEILKLVRVQQELPDRIVMASTREADGTRSVPATLREHPLCAVVPVTVLPQVSAAIASGSYGVGRLWKSLDAVQVEIDDAARLMNINTPDDLCQWQGSAAKQGED